MYHFARRVIAGRRAILWYVSTGHHTKCKLFSNMFPLLWNEIVDLSDCVGGQLTSSHCHRGKMMCLGETILHDPCIILIMVCNQFQVYENSFTKPELKHRSCDSCNIINYGWHRMLAVDAIYHTLQSVTEEFGLLR